MADPDRVPFPPADSTQVPRSWWSRCSRAQRVLVVGSVLALAAVISPGVRGALLGVIGLALGLMVLVSIFAAFVVGVLWRTVRRHPLADVAVGYLLGRRRARWVSVDCLPGWPSSRASDSLPPDPQS